MGVEIGTVRTFKDVRQDKAQAVKVLEEAAEVFGAWQEMDHCGIGDCAGCMNFAHCDSVEDFKDECADLVQALCNLLAAYEVEHMSVPILECESRNAVRGRDYE